MPKQNKQHTAGYMARLMQERRRLVAPAALQGAVLPPMPLRQIKFVIRRRSFAAAVAEDPVPATPVPDICVTLPDLEGMSIEQLQKIINDHVRDWNVMSATGEYYRHDSGFGCPFWPETHMHERRTYLAHLALSLIIYVHRL